MTEQDNNKQPIIDKKNTAYNDRQRQVYEDVVYAMQLNEEKLKSGEQKLLPQTDADRLPSKRN